MASGPRRTDVLSGGHVLPEETVVAESCRVEAFGLSGAAFVAEQDHETNFKLFGPVPAQPAGATTTRRAFALRLRPNQDFAFAIEDFCRARGSLMRRCAVASAVSSARALRTVVRSSRLRRKWQSFPAASRRIRNDGLTAELDIFLVDHLGGIAEGRLTRGDNPVLMTMELVLEA